MKVLKWISLIFLTLVLLLVGVVGVVWMKPSLVINNYTLTQGADYLRENTQIDLSWEDIDVQSSSPSFWRKSLSLQGSKVCFNDPEFMVHGCFDQLALKTVVDLTGFSFQLDSLDRLVAHADGLVIDLTSDPQDAREPPAAEESQPFNWTETRQQIDTFLQGTEVDNIDISMQNLLIRTDDLDLRADVAVERLHRPGVKDVLLLSVTEETVRGELQQNARLELKLSSTKRNFTGKWTIEGEMAFDLTGTAEIEADLALTELPDAYFGYSLDVSTSLPGEAGQPVRVVHSDLKGQTNLDQIEGSLELKLVGFLPQNMNLLAEGCQYNGAVPYLATEGKFQAGCNLVLPFNDPPEWYLKAQEVGQVTLPKRLVLKVSAETDAQFFTGAQEVSEASIHAELAPWTEDYLGVEAEVELGIRGRELTDFENLKLTPNVDLLVQIRSFERLVKVLERTPYAIPAPFHVFNGQVTFESQGVVEQRRSGYVVPLQLVTKLKSRDQSLKTRTRGQIDYNPESQKSMLHLALDVLIQDLKLQLPQIDPIAGMPATSPDPRFKSLKDVPLVEVLPEVEVPEEELEAVPLFTYNVNIVTEDPRSLMLRSNLVQGGAPIELKLNLTSERGMRGYVSIHDTQLEYLRRTAQIQQLRISWPYVEDAPSEISGLIETKQQSYEIFIQISGTLGSPQFEMWSNPDLPTNDIVSLLLFNRTREELTGGEDESASNVGAAIADGAVGLLGMWAFASTPVQSIAYNAQTGVYSASVDIGGGTSLTLGSDWDATQTLELRRRLSPNWVLTTAVEPGQKVDEDQGRVVLQWQNRY